MKRPELSKTLTPEQFQENYYRKEELQTFLKVCKVSASGSKEELNARILHILQGGTGAIAAGKRAQKCTRIEPLYLRFQYRGGCCLFTAASRIFQVCDWQ
ncbi:MAG: SAP domain-containing protein [[Clostridium] innocuum]